MAAATKKKKSKFWSDLFPEDYAAYRDALRPRTRPKKAGALVCDCFWANAPAVPSPPASGKWRLFWNNDLAAGPGWDWENLE